jgi:hypothetical protein
VAIDGCDVARRTYLDLPAVKYEPVFVWLLTNSAGQRAVVLACDSDEAQQLAAVYAPQWRGATCEKIADTRRPSRTHRVLVLEKPDAK